MGFQPAVTAPAFRNGSEARRFRTLDSGAAHTYELNPTEPTAADGVVRTVDRLEDFRVEDATCPPNGG